MPGQKQLLPLALLALLPLGPGLAAGASLQGLPLHGQILGEAQGRGVEVLLLPFAAPYREGELHLRGEAEEPAAGALSEESGRFFLEAPGAGLWRLRVAAPGLVPVDYPLVPLTEETDLPAVELPRDAGLEVRVMDEGGEPVAGARVLVETAAAEDLSQPWQARWLPAPRLAVTDAEGRVRLPAAAGETLRIEAIAPGFVGSSTTQRQRHRLSLALRRGRPRCFQVRDPERRPAAEVLAWLGPGRLPAGHSEGNGRLCLPAAGGEAEISLLAPDGASLRALLPAPSPEGALTPEPALTLVRRAPLAGKAVSAADRSPLAEALVWTDRSWGSAVRSGADGRFLLPSPPGGARALQAGVPGYFLRSVLLEEVAIGPQGGVALALEPQVALAGRVLDPTGRPLPEVEVRARYDPAAVRLPPLTLRTSGGLARSRAGGRFRVGQLVPGAAYTLRFAAPGFAPRQLAVAAPALGAFGEELVVTLAPGVRAAGRVLDGREQPVPGASVELTPGIPSGDARLRLERLRDPDPALGGRASSGRDGRFAIPDLAPGSYELRVEARGFAPARLAGLTLPEGAASFDLGTVLLAPEAAVVGRVEAADGQPLAGARVRVVPADSLEALGRRGREVSDQASAVTDAGGWFRLGGQRAGGWLKLAVECPGYAAAEVARVPAPNEEPVVVVLDPVQRLSGRVVDPAGGPVPGVGLTLQVPRMEVLGGVAVALGEVFLTRSREDGTFTSEGLPPGPVTLSAAAPGWLEAELKLRIPAGEDLEEVEVVLQPSAVIAGQVLDAEGEPVVGAELRRFEPPQPGVFSYSSPLALSDGDGRYRLAGLAAGPLRLEARHEAHGQDVREIDAALGENSLDFRFRGGRTLSGRVVDPAGAPVAEARVALGADRAGWPSRTARSDGDGSFSFQGLPEGTWQLSAEKAGNGRTREPVKAVTRGEAPPAEVLLELAATGAIRGQVLGLSLDEVAEVRLKAGFLTDVGEVLFDGSYRIPDLLPGPWQITAYLPGSGRQAPGEAVLEEGAGEAWLDLDFAAGLRLAGEVLHRGRALAGARVTAWGAAASPPATETDGGGRFVFDGLAPGLYLLEVQDYRSGLYHTREVELDRDQEVSIELITSAVAGQVIAAEDRLPLAGAEVALAPLGVVAGGGRSRALTDGDGRFELLEVGAGEWRLEVQMPGYDRAERELQLDEAHPLDLGEIPLAATEGLTLLVTDAAGRRVETLYFAALNGSGQAQAAGTYVADPAGRVRIPDLAAGEWTVLAAAPGSASAEAPVRVPGPAVPLSLPPAGSLLVSGAESQEGSVQLLGTGGRPYRRIAPGGRVEERWGLGGPALEIAAVPVGFWTLAWTTPDGSTTPVTAEVRPGQRTTVDLANP